MKDYIKKHPFKTGLIIAVVIVLLFSLSTYFIESNPKTNFETYFIYYVGALIISVLLLLIAYIQSQAALAQSKTNYLLRIDERWSSTEIIKAREVIHEFYLSAKEVNLPLTQHDLNYVIGQQILQISKINTPYQISKFISLLNFLDFLETIGYMYHATSQKLSTGVDARNVRNIVLMRPVNSMIEFKQIIGRGTRIFDGKEYFTIYDFVGAYHHFIDPSWDGEPLDETSDGESKKPPLSEPSAPYDREEEPSEKNRRVMVKIKLRDGKERNIQHMVATSFWSADGRPISAEEFMQNLFGSLPEFFKSEEELRKIWSDPSTRKALLEKLEKAGYSHDVLGELQKLINAEDSDLFDVLEYVAYNITPITREERVAKAQKNIFTLLNNTQKEFLEFVLSKYIESGVDELAQEKLPDLLRLKYRAIEDAKEKLGSIDDIRNTFIHFQKHLYQAHSQRL